MKKSTFSYVLMCLQLFEKLKLQEGPLGSQPTSKPKARETVSTHLPAHHPDGRERSFTGARLSDTVTTHNKDSLKASSKKDAKNFGKVYTRHIHQLFIRGENVILVNPQRL